MTRRRALCALLLSVIAGFVSACALAPARHCWIRPDNPALFPLLVIARLASAILCPHPARHCRTRSDNRVPLPLSVILGLSQNPP
jgi:hypothetical protein